MQRLKKYLLLTMMLFIAALNFTYFLHPFKLVTGGTQGVALLFHELFSYSPSFIILFINILTLILSYFTLSKETTYGTLAATFIYPLCVKITTFFPPFPTSMIPLFFSSCIAGIICGITGGYIYRFGFSAGGVSTLNLWVWKYFHIPVALSNFLINTIIILSGCFFFGLEKGFYSIIVILISSFIIHKIVG